MYHFVYHTKVGTFKSKMVNQKAVDETIQMLKDYAGKLTYISLEGDNGLPLFIPKGALEDMVVTVVPVEVTPA